MCMCLPYIHGTYVMLMLYRYGVDEDCRCDQVDQVRNETVRDRLNALVLPHLDYCCVLWQARVQSATAAETGMSAELWNEADFIQAT